MGYYDAHNESTRRGSNKGYKGAGIYALFGSIIGALIVLLSVPVLANYGVLPYEVVPKGTELSEDTSEVEAVIGDVPTDMVNITMTSEVIQAVDRVSDAIVGVVNMRESQGLFNPSGEGTGSGVIYKVDGDYAFIVTNQHVIEGANEIEVTLSNGSRIPADKIGEDALTDLAVLRIDSDQIETVADFGNSNMLRAGEPAIAIGNPLSFEGSVTLGIISAVERSIPVDSNRDGRIDWNAEVLQTDAAINPGNSGGALLNIQGEVIGINSMKIAQSAVEGIGFAIPSAITIPVIEDLEKHGEVLRPHMGVVIRSLQEIPSSEWQEILGLPEEVKSGVYVHDIQPDTPAAKADLQAGDVIVEMDGQGIKDSHELRRFLYTEKNVGESLTVGFYRNGEKQEVELTLERQLY